MLPSKKSYFFCELPIFFCFFRNYFGNDDYKASQKQIDNRNLKTYQNTRLTLGDPRRSIEVHVNQNGESENIAY